MDVRRWSRDAKLSLARLPSSLGLGRVPEQPAQALRDPWPGDTARGSRLMKGELVSGGATIRLVPASVVPGQPAPPGAFAVGGEVAPLLREHLNGFGWLRDLRALGTDAGRLRARALVADWLLRPPADSVAREPHVMAARLTAWLYHFDFFAATADDGFRGRLMARIVMDGRSLSALLPLPGHDRSVFACLKGLLAVGVALPENGSLLSRFMRFLPPELGRQVLGDGSQPERSPQAQFEVLRELAEMRAIMQAAQIAPPLALAASLDRMSPVLRALRHADGGLALFNGSTEGNPVFIDLVLSQSTRGRAVQNELPEGGFRRIVAGRTVLIVDAGPPPPPGLDRGAHAGTLSFEMSVGRDRLIVNCGSATDPDWREALRATAAHSTLVLGDGVSSSGLREGGLLARPGRVEADHRTAGGAHWLEFSHDGYRPAFGAVHRRRLYLAEAGDDLRGEDLLEAADVSPGFVLRFHLHPAVVVERDEEHGGALLSLPGGGRWRFRADVGRITLEDSIYAGNGTPVRCRQIVVQMRAPVPAAAPPDKLADTLAGEASRGEGETAPPVAADKAGAGAAKATTGSDKGGDAARPGGGTIRAAAVATGGNAGGAPERPEPVAGPVAEPSAIPGPLVVRWAITRLSS
ncbi:heparinase II/III family protein [Rhizosaccharibacter radicis]|uniref:Heparinase II/III family protein n=1 Tax=Rhizosaccharibacter radicis TaxID=2782605 RepID=A0ABT1VSE1_9PROT|nr:heparinase II/III family protein [Acetobacteraceae bacterium KSS12]